VDSCYLCEIGQVGIIIPFRGKEILICEKCALEQLLAHPRLAIFKQNQEQKVLR